jgi:1D-myo-inositol-triphosphate 3-kinase
LDPDEATEEERINGITKQRYMQFRERESTSATLGFRIEGIKGASDAGIDYKRMKTMEHVLEALEKFLPSEQECMFDIVRAGLLCQLKRLRQLLSQSNFFQVLLICSPPSILRRPISRHSCVLVEQYYACCPDVVS